MRALPSRAKRIISLCGNKDKMANLDRMENKFTSSFAIV